MTLALVTHSSKSPLLATPTALMEHLLSLQLSTDDLNAVKEDPLLATSQANTYLSFTSDAIADMFNEKSVSRGEV